jgi:hypothetical protein
MHLATRGVVHFYNAGAVTPDRSVGSRSHKVYDRCIYNYNTVVVESWSVTEA